MTKHLAALDIQNTLAENPEFRNAVTFREQIYCACRLLREIHSPPVPYSVIGAFWGIARGTVKSHFDNFVQNGNDHLPEGRSTLLSHEQANSVVVSILAGFSKKRPLTSTEIIDMIEKRWGIEVCNNTLHHILSRDSRIKPCKAIPMEE
jgi:hypothetical protein